MIRFDVQMRITGMDLLRAGVVFRRAIIDFLPVLWATIDREITGHIREQFARAPWEQLRPITMQLRQSEPPRNRRTGRARSASGQRLYYHRHSPSVAPGDPTAFGWTGRSRGAALAAGRFTSTRYRRDFGGGSQQGRVLRWWHFGATITVTPQMRAFLRRYGVTLSQRTTQLQRPPRAIYDEQRVRIISQTFGDRWLARLVEAVDSSGQGTSFRIIGGSQ